MWEVEYTEEFGAWWDTLTEDQQDAVSARVEQLQQAGPSLGRPAVGEIRTSKHDPQMKELRVGRSIRILFMFNPLRTAILLIGGDKTGRWRAWYQQTIPFADALYDEHLKELRDEGLL